MSAIETWLLSYLLNSLWQLPLLFAAGWLAARALRPLGPAAEHRLWVNVLMLQALLPAASTLPPELFSRISARIRALFAFFTNAPRLAGPRVSVINGPGAALTALHIPIAMLTAITAVYAAATLYFAARFLWRCLHLRKLHRESTPITLTGEAAAYWGQCLQDFAIGNIAIASSSNIGGPVTIGLARKLLLLPAAVVAALPEADLRTVIAHEFAHMRRNDFLKNLLYEFLSLPACYHPALWLTREYITETREVICDQIAAPIATSLQADSLSARNEYARSLLRLANLLVIGPPVRTPHAIGILDANAFERRLMQLTQQPIYVRTSRRLILIAACAALGLVTSVSALALRLSMDAIPSAALPSAALPSSDKKASPPEDHLTVPSDEMASLIVTKVMPKYPEEAKKERIQGKVLLNGVIGKDGSVENLTVASGPKELQQSSLDAVQHWTYKPYLLNGEPVEVETTITVVYSLSK